MVESVVEAQERKERESLQKIILSQEKVIEKLKDEVKSAAYKAYLDVFCRFSPDTRRSLANLFAHDWTVDSIGLSRLDNDTFIPQNMKLAEVTAFQYNQLKGN